MGNDAHGFFHRMKEEYSENQITKICEAGEEKSSHFLFQRMLYGQLPETQEQVPV